MRKNLPLFFLSPKSSTVKKGGFVVVKNWLGKFPLNDDTKKNWASRISIEQQTTTTTSVPRRALEFESPWDRARAAGSTRAHLLRRLARGRRSSSFFFRESKRERKKGKNDNLSGGVPL